MKKNRLIIACLLVMMSIVYMSAQGFPMDTIYRMALEGRSVRGGHDYALRARMLTKEDLNLPVKDLFQLRFQENPKGLCMFCSFRFQANERALHQRIPQEAFGPVRVNYGPSVFESWYLPGNNIKVSIGAVGKIASNGNADYVYSIEPMSARDKAGFFKNGLGKWDRFLIGSTTVGLSERTGFSDRVRTLRPTVLPADNLAVYMLESANTLFLHLNGIMPRKDVPAVGQIYATSSQSALFPFGFVGKVVSVCKDKTGFKVEFGEVDELELFDIK